jgi:hypothetical protein
MMRRAEVEWPKCCAGLDLGLPVRSNIEKECDFGADRREGLNDPGPPRTASFVLPRAT